jgi:NOL1/NOP2/fmu family ribosome biogenesis protein
MKIKKNKSSMQKLLVLNKKQIKKILELIKTQWDADIELDYTFLKNNKNKIFIINKEITIVNLEKLKINSIGLYFGVLVDNLLRLSIEGSQIIGSKSRKNVLKLDDNKIKKWLKGEDLVINSNISYGDFIIIKNNNDFYGCGKVKDNIILNYVPKIRRISF